MHPQHQAYQSRQRFSLVDLRDGAIVQRINCLRTRRRYVDQQKGPQQVFDFEKTKNLVEVIKGLTGALRGKKPMLDLDKVALLGIDVGFSRSRPTTGIAWSNGRAFKATNTHTDWLRRSQHIPASTTFSVIAIDGPLVPLGSADSLDRLCERMFIRGAFQSRCKPGLSHIGYGRDLRRAAAETAEQVVHLADRNVLVEKAIRNGASIVEAFPNAFLGVLLPEARFAMPAAGKRKKFDWLYDHAVDSGVLENLFHTIGWLNLELIDAVLAEKDHEKRAAWICLLTAACAAAGKSEVVGDEVGGWFWLPPTNLWAQWARNALAHNTIKLRRQRHAS